MPTAALSLILVVQAGAVPAPLPVSAPLAAKVTPAYKTYRVKKGDTLFSIAEHFYGTGRGTWRVIAKENGVTPQSLKPGMVLRIPLDPKKVFEKEAEKASSSRSRTRPKKPTLGDTMDAVGKRVRVFMNLLGLRFQPGPTYPFRVVLAIFVGCILYVLADALMILLGSLLLRMPDPTFRRAAKVAIGSAGLQLLLFLSLLMIGAVVNQIWPDTANLENLRSLSWHSRGVWWSAVLTLFLAFFFIPMSIAKQTYGVTPTKAGSVIFLALALKCFVAFFPSAVAFIATGAGVT